LTALSDVGDVGVLMEWWWWKAAEQWCQCCRENGEKNGTTFFVWVRKHD
jgi:hypothetical protein